MTKEQKDQKIIEALNRVVMGLEVKIQTHLQDMLHLYETEARRLAGIFLQELAQINSAPTSKENEPQNQGAVNDSIEKTSKQRGRPKKSA